MPAEPSKRLQWLTAIFFLKDDKIAIGVWKNVAVPVEIFWRICYYFKAIVVIPIETAPAKSWA